MKQFEKWDKRVKVKTWSGNIQEREERKWYREQTWRAALEMIRLIHEKSYDKPEEGIYVGDIIRDKIEQELGGT